MNLARNSGDRNYIFVFLLFCFVLFSLLFNNTLFILFKMNYTVLNTMNIIIWMRNINYGISLPSLLSVRSCTYSTFFVFIVWYIFLIRFKIVPLFVYLVWWAFHPFKLLEVFLDERYDLLKCLCVAEPFPFYQFIKVRLQYRSCVSDVMKQQTK